MSFAKHAPDCIDPTYIIQKVSGPNAKNPNRTYNYCNSCNKFLGFVDERKVSVQHKSAGPIRPQQRYGARDTPIPNRRDTQEPDEGPSLKDIWKEVRMLYRKTNETNEEVKKMSVYLDTVKMVIQEYGGKTNQKKNYADEELAEGGEFDEKQGDDSNEDSS